jgi:hypothetical protein
MAQDTERGIAFLLWSNKHQAWWRPNAKGYTSDRAEAGRFTQAEALDYVLSSAYSGLLSSVTCMVAAPEGWPGA